MLQVPKSILTLMIVEKGYTIRALISMNPDDHYEAPEDVINAVKRVVKPSGNKGSHGANPNSDTYQLMINYDGKVKVEITRIRYPDMDHGRVAKYYGPLLVRIAKEMGWVVGSVSDDRVLVNKLFESEEAETIAASY
jgi:hypothetical protein